MLFIQSNTLAHTLADGRRTRLLDALAARGHNPLVRTLRRRCFETLAASRVDSASLAAAVAELERAAARDDDAAKPHTPGELFPAGDCVLALLFREETDGDDGHLLAAVVYDIDTAEPLRKLERFCRDVRDALTELKPAHPPSTSEAAETSSTSTAPSSSSSSSTLPDWRARDAATPQGLARFIAAQPAELVRAAALRGGRELARASELLEEPSVRHFLRRVETLRREGFTPRRLLREAGAVSQHVSLETMLDAGLLERELRVSCRKSGHALFDLPSPDSLAAVTISRARCSLCAAPVADEVIEETINPTRLATSLLEDGRWLSTRVYKLIRSLGVPESEIATGPATPGGESHLAAEVCGNSFLFVTRDGDLTPALARRLVEAVEETEATHLVVIITGAIEDEGQLRLYEYAWRRARSGRDLDVTLVEGLTNARPLVERAFERAIRRQLARHLSTLDPALGFPVAHFVLGWFKSLKSARAHDTQPLALPRRAV